jgi:hypothetical protein
MNCLSRGGKCYELFFAASTSKVDWPFVERANGVGDAIAAIASSVFLLGFGVVAMVK